MILVSWGRGPVSGVFSPKVGPKGPALMRFHVIKKIFLYFCPFAVTCFTWPDAASDAWGTTFQLGCPSLTPYTNIPVASDTCLLAGIPGLLSKVGPKGPTLTRFHVIKKINKLSFCCNLLLLDQMQLSCLYLYQNFLWRMLIYILTTFGLKCFFQLISSVCKSGRFLLSEL